MLTGCIPFKKYDPEQEFKKYYKPKYGIFLSGYTKGGTLIVTPVYLEYND